MEIYSENLLQLYRDRESTRQGAMSVDRFGEACLLPLGICSDKSPQEKLHLRNADDSPFGVDIQA